MPLCYIYSSKGIRNQSLVNTETSMISHKPFFLPIHQFIQTLLTDGMGEEHGYMFYVPI